MQGFKKMKTISNGHQAQVVNILAAHRYGEAFFFQSRSAAGFTCPQIDVARQIVAHSIRRCFSPSAFQLPDRPFEGSMGEEALAGMVMIELDGFRSRSVKKNIFYGIGKFVEGCVDVEFVM